MGVLILGVNSLYRLFCFFKLFPMVSKGLIVSWFPAFLAKSALSQFEVIRTFENFQRRFSYSDYAPDKIETVSEAYG